MYYTYILSCSDGTFYSGCTNDLEKRLHEHNHSKSGAHYTKIRRPASLVWSQRHRTYAKAREHEAYLKRLSRVEKVRLINKDIF